MTFTCCWKHLEAAVVTEAAQIKDECRRIILQGGEEIVSATIQCNENTTGHCQVCGAQSNFSVYYQATQRIPEVR